MSDISIEDVRSERGNYGIIDCWGSESFKNCNDIEDVFRTMAMISADLTSCHKGFVDIIKQFKFTDYHMLIRDVFGAYTASAFIMYISAIQDGSLEDNNYHFEKLPDNIRFIIHTNDESKTVIEELTFF